MSKQIRCAIYTRKSTEEGLDQQFNSLDAQREACEAYIASQRHEGWKALPKHYDDGGYSGGNTQRPALQALLTDIATGKVDLVVVYKIDRLTRSLTDFAKMVDVFDKHQTSFVSVTQHFNTTTSMGRLTLNVLLSFAQFEREVTGERIRDKIAASKKKGMWVGGNLPLGYDVKDKALVVNAKEAILVRQIFRRYLALGSVSKLKDELDAQGVTSKTRVNSKGERSGGRPFSRGALYWLLQNRYYLGEVSHAGQHYPGQHKAIIHKELWDQVQQSLAENRRLAKSRVRAVSPSLLAGRVYLLDGTRLTPTHTNKQGKRYRYYTVGYPKIGEPKPTGKKVSIPAHDLEVLVERSWKILLVSQDLQDRLRHDPEIGAEATQRMQALARDWDKLPLLDKQAYLQAAHTKVHVSDRKITLSAHPELIALQHLHPLSGCDKRAPTGTPIRESVDIQLQISRTEKRIIEPGSNTINMSRELQKEQLLQRIALGRAWVDQLVQGKLQSTKEIALRENKNESYVYDILRAGCLAPAIVDQIANNQNVLVPLEELQKSLQISWKLQARTFGLA